MSCPSGTFWRVCKYLFCQRFQKWAWRSLINLHHWKWDRGILAKFGSTCAVLDMSVRKWLAVKTLKSDGSELEAPRGRELRVASMRVRSVFSSSYLSHWSPSVRYKNGLTDLTPASHSPPKWGAEGGLKCQLILWFIKYVWHLSWYSLEWVNLSTSWNSLALQRNSYHNHYEFVQPVLALIWSNWKPFEKFPKKNQKLVPSVMPWLSCTQKGKCMLEYCDESLKTLTIVDLRSPHLLL